MAHSERKRQQKLVKKQRRANELKKQRNVRLNMSDREWIAVAQRAPWIGCYTFGADGMHQVIAIRQGRSDLLACAFLLDVYCLGVKKCQFVRGIDMEMLRQNDAHPISPSHALKWVQESMAYGSRNGFEPPATCEPYLKIFEGADASQCTTEFEFGKDGKPHFIPGPHDSIEFMHRTVQTLRKLGDGNYTADLDQNSRNSEDYGLEFDDDDDEVYDVDVEEKFSDHLTTQESPNI